MNDMREFTVVLMLLMSSAFARPSSSSSTWDLANGNKDENRHCEPDHLTVYRVILNTFWNDKTFPKHFPQWRPPAQWTKLVGRSHDESYVLFRLGQKASEGLKIFAEDGRSDALDAQSQGEGGVYDEFNAPPVTSGQGRTEAEFFVDGNHSRVSLISKMVPSPDWFIGIDSFDLCVNGKWLDGITIEVDTLDAATDNGFTFTSPNWPAEAQGAVYRLTSSYPNHPASSFFYPGVKKLPTMATFKFIKVKEYELSEVFHHSDESLANEILKMEHVSYVYEQGEGNTFVLNKNASSPTSTTSTTTTSTTTTTTTTSAPSIQEAPAAAQSSNMLEPSGARDAISAAVSRTTEASLDVADPANATGNKGGRNKQGSKMAKASKEGDAAFVKNIVDIYSSKKAKPAAAAAPHDAAAAGSDQQRHHAAKGGGKRVKPKKDVRKIRPPRDCQVSDWTDWSPCSKSCDIGESHRIRKVLHHARRGGQPCPPLHEKKWCGSARSCNRRYFDWAK